MTNRERLISLLGFAPDVNSIDGALVDAGIDGAVEYTMANSIVLKTAAIGLMELLLTTADTSNENGYSIRYDRGAIIKRIGILKDELEIVAGKPTITSLKVW